MNNMKNLVERMNASHRETLMKAREIFPCSINGIIGELERNHFWPELTYDTISALVSHLGLKGYDPSTISDVFDNR